MRPNRPSCPCGKSPTPAPPAVAARGATFVAPSTATWRIEGPARALFGVESVGLEVQGQGVTAHDLQGQLHVGDIPWLRLRVYG